MEYSQGSSDDEGRGTAFLARYNQDSQSTDYINRLARGLSLSSPLILAEELPPSRRLAADSPNVFRVWRSGSDDFSVLQRTLSEKNIKVLHIDCECSIVQNSSFVQMLERCIDSGMRIVPHISSLELFDSLPKTIIAHACGVFCGSASSPSVPTSNLNILMQNRGSALSHPGGDTVVMQRLAEGLSKRGHTVEIDVEGKKDPNRYDLVHLFNFATPEITENYARRCNASGTPYVVTTLYEDWPSFYSQMNSVFLALEAYVEAGQPQGKWAELLEAAKDVDPKPAPNNAWTAEYSAALIATGGYEANNLREDYPKASRVEVCRFGFEVDESVDDGEMFVKEFGLKDFVLCVGRLETRKNQLMLLKALEDSPLDVVLATGGFTYQPEYEAACRAFKRKGKTVFLDRLEPQMLASAFAAAKVHVLPSWFELPGLVSLEAARYGTNVVVTDRGTARDYFGELATYCNPDDSESIANATIAAYYSPPKAGLREHVAQFSWDNAVEQNLRIYENVLGRDKERSESREEREVSEQESLAAKLSKSVGGLYINTPRAASSAARTPEVVGQDVAGDTASAKCLCSAGDVLLKKDKVEEARRKYEDALGYAPNFPRALRSLGVMALQQKEIEQAEHYFRKALRYDPQDTKSLLGLGAVEWDNGKKEEAFSLYLRAAENDTSDPTAILYLVNSGYELEKVSELEQALRRFLVEEREDNLHIQYCLAGCYFHQKRYTRASGVLERILRFSPDHAEALELKSEIEKRISDEAKQKDEKEEKVSVDVEAAPSFKIPNISALEGDFGRVWERESSTSAKLALLEEAKKQKEYERVRAYAAKLLQQTGLGLADAALARILRAESLGCLGESVEADREFTQVETDPVYGYRALVGRGALAASAESWDDAKSFFNRALMIKPDYDVAVAGMGICLTNKGEKERAWDYFQKAIAINCENLQAIWGIIQLGYELGRLEATKEALEGYLDLNPGDLSTIYSYAGCLFALGQIEEAKEQCEKMLLLQPDNELAKELLDKLRGESLQTKASSAAS